jgi:hypothetical protein
VGVGAPTTIRLPRYRKMRVALTRERDESEGVEHVDPSLSQGLVACALPELGFHGSSCGGRSPGTLVGDHGAWCPTMLACTYTDVLDRVGSCTALFSLGALAVLASLSDVVATFASRPADRVERPRPAV